MNKDKHLGLKLDSETHHKLKMLAQFEERSMNGEVMYLICDAFREFEKKYGKVNDTVER